MVKKTVNMGTDDPEQKKFELPSEGEHTFQVVDTIDNPDPNIVVVKLEITDKEEFGRSMLHRVSLDSEWKGFFLSRLFLKAVQEPHKGDGVEMDSDNWIGRQFTATVIHNEANNGKVYANISEYQFDKVSEVVDTKASTPVTAEQEWDKDL